MTPQPPGPSARLGRRRRERGGVSIVGIAIIVLLFALTMILAVPAAGGIARKQTASTAADSAALAAAESWSEQIKKRYVALSLADPAGIATFMNLTSVDAVSRLELTAEAETLASANDADVVDVRLDARRLEVTVTVRDRQESIPGTGIYARETATAQVNFHKGVCLRQGKLSIVLDGRCLGRVPKVESPTTDPEAPAPPPVFPPTAILERFRSDTTLVR